MFFKYSFCGLVAAIFLSGCGGSTVTQKNPSESPAKYMFAAGNDDYRVHYNYTGKDWWLADVQAIKVQTEKPIAVLPQQYTTNGKQPGAFVNGRHVGRIWNEITQAEMARRLNAAGFYVLTPTIQMYGESLDGFQGLEHFIAGVAKGNPHVQVILLTADAHDANAQNPLPGAQMLVSGTQPRDLVWEARIQKHISAFYQHIGLGNRGARVRGGVSMVEGSSQAWHPLIERAAQFTPMVSIMEVSRAIDIENAVGRVDNGAAWASELFDAVAAAMEEQACANGYKLSACN